MIIKLLNARKTEVKKNYGFDEVFTIFGETDNSCYKLQIYNPRTFTMINRKNEMLEYLEIIKSRLTHTLSTPSLIKNINNANYKGNVNEKSNEQMNSGDTRHAQAIIDSFTFKKIKTEGDEVKLEPEETIAEGVKLRRQKADDKNYLTCHH